MNLNKLTGAHFRPLIHGPVRLKAPDGEVVELVLVEVAEPVPAGAGEQRPPFCVLYRGPLARFLPQGLYPVDHPGLGTLEIFIVPVRQDLDGTYYEAVFN